MDGGTKCKDLRDAHSPNAEKMFQCHNQRKGNGSCSGRRFLYPRKWAKSFKGPGDEPAFHFHQGIDIFADSGTEILSVTHGTVVQIQKWNGDSSGYGHVVAVYTPDPSGGPGITYWYAHCQEIMVGEGDEVREKQPIAKVGNSGKAGAPHLHFETLRGKISRRIGGYTDERKIGDSGEFLRLDPLDVLEALGPWGMQNVFDPQGNEVSPVSARGLHAVVESSPHGGYFPLGANNHWHGGVHLRMPKGSEIVAPFDATIVAARLDPDPTYANHPDGSINFILLRHEIPETYHQLFQGKRPHEVGPSSGPAMTTKDRAIGRKSRCANEPADVIAVKHELHAITDPDGRPYFDPDDPAELDDPIATKALEKAIIAFQEREVEGLEKADGVVDIPGKTWLALHGGTPPAEPKPTEPTAPPPPPAADPTRVLYSLLMHLQPAPIDAAVVKAFPWVTRVKLAPSPGEPDPAEEEAKRVREERAGDLSEAEHTLSGAVGAPNGDGVPADNLPDDVLWVHKRLVRFGYHPGPPSSTCTEALIDAVAQLQNEHHSSFKAKKDGDGRVDTNGGTVTLLRTTRDALLGKGGDAAASVDPIFLHRITVRDEHEIAKVITGLHVKVRSGEPLWRSSQARGYAADGSLQMLDQIHWELFSEHLLVTDWEDPIEDTNEDLTADVPKHLMDFFEGDAPEADQDGLLTLDEVRQLYRSGRGELLRRTPCRFVNQWSLDVDQMVTTLADMGYDTEGLRERLQPVMWWSQAADVLPATRIVWHYNPIEFLADYAEHLVAMQPPGELDPTTHPTLLVHVRYDDHQPMPGVEVQLLYGIETLRAAKTDAEGTATFRGVAVGDYGVRVHDPATAPIPVELRPGETNEVELLTDVPGPPLSRGSLHITVRKHTGTIAGDDIEVWLEHAAAGPVTNDYTNNGKLSFEDIPYGEYVMTAGDAEPITVTLDKKDKTVPAIVLPPPLGTLRVKVTIEGEPASLQQVEILDADVPRKLTDHAGVTTFELREGHYRARVGMTTKKVRASADGSTYTIELAAKEAPPPQQGTLYAWVHEHGKEVVDQPVMVFSPDGRWLDTQSTDREGCATFRLPAEPVLVATGNAKASTTVIASDFTSVNLALDT